MASLSAPKADKSTFSTYAAVLITVDGIAVLAVVVTTTLLSSEEGWSFDDTVGRAADAEQVSFTEYRDREVGANSSN